MAETIPTKPTVGVVGLGAMGSKFASRLLAGGYVVHAYNRSPGRAPELDSRGLIREASPRELASASDVILVMLWDSAASKSTFRGSEGLFAGIRPDTVIVDLSTIEPQVSIKLAAEANDFGAFLLDCPVSGSLDRAASGELLVMAGGAGLALERVMSVLRVLARRVIHVGQQNGSGLALKLAINHQVATQLVGWGEAISLTDRFGIDRMLASEIMLDSVIASPMLKYRVPFSLAEPTEVWASALQLRKDVAYAQEITVNQTGAGALALKLLDEVIASGRGEREAVELLIEARDHGAIKNGTVRR